MEDATSQKLWINTLFRRTKVVRLISYVRLELNIDFILQRVSCMLYDTRENVKKFETQQLS